MLFLYLDDGRDTHLPKDGSKNPKPEEYMCLLRATLAKQKISTVVSKCYTLFLVVNRIYAYS